MPTIPQLPIAPQTTNQDEIPLSQAGIMRSVSVGELLAGTQPSLIIPSPSILGRASLGPGEPEPLAVGSGVIIQNATLNADGLDHINFTPQPTLTTTDEAVLNSSGVPKRMALPLLRGLFSAGANVAIDGTGVISASTDPSVTSQLTSLSSGLTATEASVTSLSARIPAGGYVTLNAQGQVTQPVVGVVGQATVAVGPSDPARTLVSKSLDTLNVIDFGAVPGGTDCTAAFNAAFAALPTAGGEIFVPAGDFWLASPLVWSNKALALHGAGRGISRIHFSHTGIGFDFNLSNVFSKIVLRGFSAYAEASGGQTAAVARITYPSITGFGYVSSIISEVECFGYPNPSNGLAPFPQTFLRGFVLNNCWSMQISNISWFGPPAAAGSTASAVIEVNRSIDTRIHGLQAYYGNAAVIQTGYCEGVYISSPLIVGVDYLFKQTDETTWVGYVPNTPMLLGLWVSNGEINTNLGTVQLAAVTDGFFVGLDITRNGGPNTSQTLFDLTNVSNLHVTGCNFVGGPTGGNSQDVAFNFKSTFNSSNNIIDGCHFEDMATVIRITGANGTVGLTTYGLQIGNVPLSTAIVDNTAQEAANHLSFITPSSTGIPAGLALTQDHVLSGRAGAVLFRVNNVTAAANFIRHQPATASNPPTICFDGTDGQVNGVLQTKGGNLYVNAAGASTGSGNLLSLLNTPNATSWIVVQNALTGNLSLISTNAGGIGLQPKGALWLSPASGLFAPGLPTTKPTAGSNQVWNNNGVMSIA